MSTINELRDKWEARREEHARLGSLVRMDAVCADVLADLSGLLGVEREPTVTPGEAAREAGYHEESIHRMIRKGQLKNYGTQRRPRVRLSECPRKAPATPKSVAHPPATETASGAPPELALDVLASRRNRNRSPRSA